MIRLFLGNVGSGKTISAIKEMVDNDDFEYYPYTFSNITSNEIMKNISLTSDMLFEKKGQSILFNKNFWIQSRDQYDGFNVVIDEAHKYFDARSFSSVHSKAFSQFIAMVRKICNSSTSDNTLTLISQLDRRLDVIAREMSTEIRWHICHYKKTCPECLFWVQENNEQIHNTKLLLCPYCSTYLEKSNFIIHVQVFKNIFDFEKWRNEGFNTVAQQFILTDVEKYFSMYDTNQIDDLISDQ